MAVESSKVTADVIEVSEFPELLQRYHVRGVPKTIINERVSVEGALPESALVNRVVEAAAALTGM